MAFALNANVQLVDICRFDMKETFESAGEPFHFAGPSCAIAVFFTEKTQICKEAIVLEQILV